MQRNAVIFTAAFVFAVVTAPGAEQSAIFLVEAQDCVSMPLMRRQTGFLLEGKGLVTALHGVAGCSKVSAAQPERSGMPHKGLRPQFVDIEHDVVVLSGPTLPSAPCLKQHPTSLPDAGPIKVIGHPSGIAGLWEMELQLSSRSFMPLGMVVGDLYEAIRKRGSPAVDVHVLGLNGNLQPGHSGAPILDASGRVLGVASGGLGKGSLGIGWAIPLAQVQWVDAGARAAQMKNLAWNEPALVFACDETLMPTEPPVVRSHGSGCVDQAHLFDFDRGSNSVAQNQGDLFLEAKTQVERTLEPNPWGPAVMAVIGGRVFDRVTLEALRSLDYGRQGVDSSRNERNRLPPGTVLAVRTDEGRFAKVQIQNSQGDAVRFDWVTYALPGEGPSPAPPLLQPCGYQGTLLCGSGSLAGDAIDSFNVLLKTSEALDLTLRYRYNPAHGQVFVGTMLLDEEGSALADGFFPTAAPTSGEVRVKLPPGRSASRYLLVWLYESYKSEAFACRRFDYRSF